MRSSKWTLWAPVLLLLGAAGPSCLFAAGLAFPVVPFDAGSQATGLLVEDHRIPEVHLTIVLPAGSLSPWGRTHQIDEAWELQLFDSPGALRARIDRLSLNLYLTGGCLTSALSLSCRRDLLPEALAIVRDLLANRDLDRKEIRRRHRQAQLGFEAQQNDPAWVRGRETARLLFSPGDPRLRSYEPPDPALTDIEKLLAGRDQLLRLPGRIVGFAGDLSPAEAEKWTRELNLPPPSAPPAGLDVELKPLTAPEQRPRERTFSIEKLTQEYFGLYRDSLRYEDRDYPALMIANHILGGHFYSRLYEALRHKEGDTYGANSVNNGGKWVGSFGLVTFTNTANGPQAEAKVREVLVRLHDGGITEDERAKAAGYLVHGRALRRQSADQVLRERIQELTLGLPPGAFQQMAERAAALPLDEVNAFIRRFFDPAAFSLVRVVPQS